MEKDPALAGTAYIEPTTKVVLIIDHDETRRDRIGSRLSDRGYGVLAADSGGSATRIARERKPDLILLDLGLRGTNGHDLLDRFARDPATRAIPVVVVAGDTDPAARARAFEHGAIAFMETPRHAETLLVMVESIFH